MEGNIGIVLKIYNLNRAFWSSEALMVIVRYHDIKNPWHNLFVRVIKSVIVDTYDIKNPLHNLFVHVI